MTSIRRLAAIGALTLLCAACASERAEVLDTERMLGAAGFQARPADTAAQEAQLAALPPRKVIAQHLQAGGGDTLGYFYADPEQCHCIYVGDAKAYQAYQQMAFEQKLADERVQAAELNADAAMDWGMWGPGFWGPGPAVVVHGRR
jgi:hypothetical protein